MRDLSFINEAFLLGIIIQKILKISSKSDRSVVSERDHGPSDGLRYLYEITAINNNSLQSFCTWT